MLIPRGLDVGNGRGTMLSGYIALNYGWQYVFGVLGYGTSIICYCVVLPDFKAKKVDRKARWRKK